VAINDPNYRYATQTWEADGVRTQYEIAFDGGYIRQSDVVAFSVLVDPDTGLVTDRTIHALTFLSEAGTTATVQITPAVPTGRRVVIFRSTDKSEPLVNYEDDSVLTEANLDLANKQAIFGIAEIMDGLNSASVDITNSVQEIIDINTLIQEVYTSVLEILSSGGIISVAPVVFSGVGNGVTTDFPMPGADLYNAAFYDTTVDGKGMKPGVEFSIIEGATPADTVIRFTTAPANTKTWFTVLRGFAKPYLGEPPLTTTAPRIVFLADPTATLDNTYQNCIIVCTSASDIVLTLAGATLDTQWKAGQFVTAVGTSTGRPSFVATGGTVTPPTDFLAKARALNSPITATCLSQDTKAWFASGDLQRSSVVQGSTIINMIDRVALIGTNVAAGSTVVRDSYIMPHGLILDSIAASGLVASLAVAQTTGVLFTVDVLRNGTSILATKITIDNSEKTSTTAATAAVYTTSPMILLQGDEITFVITQIGTALAKGLRLYLKGQRT
jgi:tail fiber protein